MAALALGLACIVPAVSASAQILGGDERVATLPYREGEVVPLRGAAGGYLAIVFGAGERVLNVEIGDPEAFDLSLPDNRDSLLLRPLRAPVDPQISVRTDLRDYLFAFDTSAPSAAPYLVRFSYGPAQPEPTAVAPAISASTCYRLSGTRELRPQTVSDDGVRTYLTWAADQALPAVFAINPLGGEEIVDGYMRGDVFTIDRVHTELVFRIGRRTAKARRYPDNRRR